MKLFDCEKFRLAVVAAGVLFLLGLALQIPRALVGVEFPLVTTLFSGIGLAAVVLSPVVIVLTAALALLPGVAERLALCER
jgi:hypothetical protein